LIEAEQSSFKTFQLNDEAEHIVAHGSHEVVVFNAIPKEGILQSQLMVLEI
jgi:hypothetical protein